MDIKRVYKVKDENVGPKPGLKPDQFPKMVEDPFTGEMKPYKEEGGKEDKEKVEDDLDDKDKVRLYTLTKQFVKRLQPVIYPSYDGDVNDLASEAYMQLSRPRTSREDAMRLREEEPGKSKEWYRYGQTKFPKVAPAETFDPEKDGNNYEGFIKLLISRFLKDKVRTDSKVREGVKLSSMDTTTFDENGEATENVAGREASNIVATESLPNADDMVDRILAMSADEQKLTRKHLRKMSEQQNLDDNVRLLIGKVLKATKPKAEIERENKKPSYHMQTKGLVGKDFSADEFPFGVKPSVRSNENHQRGLVFSFATPKEAKEALEAHDAEMQEKGFNSGRLWGKTIKYSPKGE